MAILTGRGVVASASTPDGFVVGAVPTTEVGFVKEADQTAIFVYSSDLYKIYFKEAGGNWVRHADIQQVPTNNIGLTYPWGNYTAVCFAAADPKQKIHVHIKRGTVLYDTTPEDPNDNNFALLSGAQEINIQTGNYSLPEDDGTDGQILKTDGAGNVTWASHLPPGGYDGNSLITDGAGNVSWGQPHPPMTAGFLEVYMEGAYFKQRWSPLPEPPDPGAKFLSKLVLLADQDVDTEIRGEHNLSPNVCRWTKIMWSNQFNSPHWTGGGLTSAEGTYTIPEDGWYEISSTIQWVFMGIGQDTWFDAVIASDSDDAASSPTQLRKYEDEKYTLPGGGVGTRVGMFPLASSRFLQAQGEDMLASAQHSEAGGMYHHQRTTNISATVYCAAGEKISVYVRQGHAPDAVNYYNTQRILGHTQNLAGNNLYADYYRGVESNLIIKKL